MNKRLHSHKKADSSASNPVRSQFQSRPFIAQAKPKSQKPVTQTETENQEFQQHKFEATKLELQAKYGIITPEGQERLTVLQAKMSGTLQRRLEHALSNGSNLTNIPISSPDAPSQLAVQRKLTIGEPGDKYEQEADRVASQVVKQINTPAPQQTGQSQPIQREEVAEEEEKLQMKPMLQLRAAVGGITATADLETEIKQARGSGQSLADSIKLPIEQAFGADFSGVKIHTDAKSDKLNQSIQAKAFTTGQDIFFRQGAYDPGSRGGQELLAHELTHVIQQNGSAVQAKPDIVQRTSDTVIQAWLETYKPKHHNPLSGTPIEQEALDAAFKVDQVVQEAYREFIKGDYQGASDAQIDLYILRLSEYQDNKKTMHPSTAAGYVIEGKANEKIKRLGYNIQQVGDIKGSRPDVTIPLSNGQKALVDITSEKSIGHIFNKAGNWTNHVDIPYVAESLYPSINFEDPSKTAQLTPEEREKASQLATKRQEDLELANRELLEQRQEKYTQLQNEIKDMWQDLYDMAFSKKKNLTVTAASRQGKLWRAVGLSVNIDTQLGNCDVSKIPLPDFEKEYSRTTPQESDIRDRKDWLDKQKATIQSS